LDPLILEALKNEKVKEVFLTKISPERIRIELEKMLKHKNA
jgi:tRNA nucleotidyltransferase/poly(A) polymerase